MEEEERKFIEKLEGMEKGNSIEKMFENIWEYTKILRNTNKKGKQKKREIREKIINKEGDFELGKVLEKAKEKAEEFQKKNIRMHVSLEEKEKEKELETIKKWEEKE